MVFLLRDWVQQRFVEQIPVVVDVPVIMQLQFQQVLGRAGASQFMNSSLCSCATETEPTVQTLQKTAEIPQVLFLVDVAVIIQVPAVTVGGASDQFIDRVFGGLAVGLMVFHSVFTVFFGLRPLGRRVPASSGEFSGALHGQQLLVAEGSGCTIGLRGC